MMNCAKLAARLTNPPEAALKTSLPAHVDLVRKQAQAGKSLDEIKAAGLPEKYKNCGSGFISAPIWIETIHRSRDKPAGK